jgi:hypothetical protein
LDELNMPQTDTADTPATRYCLGCGYIIDHLTERRCPECGREFDPADIWTFTTVDPADWQRIRRRGLLGVVLIVASAVPGAGVVMMPGFLGKVAAAVPLLVMLGAGSLMLQNAMDKNMLLFYDRGDRGGLLRDFCIIAQLCLMIALMTVALVCGMMMIGVLGLLIFGALSGRI